MSNEPDAADGALSGWGGSQLEVEQIRPTNPPPSNYDGSDLRFIGTVLADLIVFARLNRLEELEADLSEARTKFLREVGYVDETKCQRDTGRRMQAPAWEAG